MATQWWQLANFPFLGTMVTVTDGQQKTYLIFNSRLQGRLSRWWCANRLFHMKLFSRLECQTFFRQKLLDKG